MNERSFGSRHQKVKDAKKRRSYGVKEHQQPIRQLEKKISWIEQTWTKKNYRSSFSSWLWENIFIFGFAEPFLPSILGTFNFAKKNKSFAWKLAVTVNKKHQYPQYSIVYTKSSVENQMQYKLMLD